MSRNPFVLVLASCVTLLQAGTIISVTGPHGSTLALSATNQILATSWSSTQGYANVDIAFESNFGPFSGTAYLMTQIGPSTTAVQQIQSNDYSVTLSTLTLTTLFTNLTLTPGSYFLVLTSSSLGGWDTPYTAGPTLVTTGGGVTWLKSMLQMTRILPTRRPPHLYS